jgi:ferric-dicitrate binding protein FerR (iron transport regulator)
MARRLASIPLLLALAGASHVCLASETNVPRELMVIDGAILFESETMATLVREINRHHGCRLSIADDAIASMEVGGGLRLADFHAIVRRLEKGLKLHALWIRSRKDSQAEIVVLHLGRMTRKSKSAIAAKSREIAATAVSCVS